MGYFQFLLVFKFWYALPVLKYSIFLCIFLSVLIMAVIIIRNNWSAVPHDCSDVSPSGAHKNRKTYNEIPLLTVL
jgi:hypothetical protein